MIARSRALGVIAAILHKQPGAAGARLEMVSWLPVLQVANEHLLGPTLYTALESSNRLAALPADVRDYLALLAAMNGERNAALREQAVEAIGALNAVGIRPMLLKGALALFADVYPDSRARMLNDIDIMVPEAEALRAVDALAALGYELGTGYEPGQHAVGEFMRDGDPGAIDLHVALIDARYLLPADGVWSRAQALTRDGVEFAVPAATDMVLHNLLHTQIHHGANFYRGVVELRQLYEFATLAHRHAATIDWDALAQHLARHRLEALLDSYALLAGRFFGLSWPRPHRPSSTVRLHAARCYLELCWPSLQALAAPWANLRFAFASHRMHDLYPGATNLVASRLRHAGRFLRKSNARDFVWRLFRPQ
jgi:hypothetical protein